jgi:hypothetical protein
MRKLFFATFLVLAGVSGWIINDLLVPPADVPAETPQHKDRQSESARAGTSQVKEKPEYVPDELLVTFKPGTSETRIKEINTSLSVHVQRKMFSGQIYQVKILEGKSLEEVRRAYLSFAEVESVEPNYKVEMKARDDVGK